MCNLPPLANGILKIPRCHPSNLSYQCCPKSSEMPQVCSRSRHTFQEEIRQFLFFQKPERSPKLCLELLHMMKSCCQRLMLITGSSTPGKPSLFTHNPTHPPPIFVLTLAVKDPCPHHILARSAANAVSVTNLSFVQLFRENIRWQSQYATN